VIHIGGLIQKEVEAQRLTYKEFGALIHKHEKTVPDIYDRATMSIDLLIAISAALNKDFIKFFYEEEPMKRLRNDEVESLNLQMEKLNLQIQKVTDENKLLQRELALIQNLTESQKETLSFAKEQIEHYKLKLSELANKAA
jgi:predicted RNase H-like nuclease (RuvC/YqgF family)